MYTDEWRKKGISYSIEARILISGPVYYRHIYDEKGKVIGVIVDYECADDFHYELLVDDWQKFCDQYLKKGDEKQMFQQFIEKNDSLFAFEDALKQADIPFKKCSFF